MTGVPVPPLVATVTVLVCAALPNVAVMVAVPALTPVTVKLVLELPGETTAVDPTEAIEGADETSAMEVLPDTAALIPAVRTCAFPGASVTALGTSDVSVGVPPPPDGGAPAEAINK